MLQRLKTYWIATLVITLVGLHGAIVAMVRWEAMAARQNASCEIDLGQFRVTGPEEIGPLSLRLTALAPTVNRTQSRQLIELNLAQVRQNIEEHLRQVPHDLLRDPLLCDLKDQLQEIMSQTVGVSACQQVLITELSPLEPNRQWQFGAASRDADVKLVITRQALQEELMAEAAAIIEAQHAAEKGDGHGSHGDAGHGGDAHSEDGHGSHDEHSGEAHGGHEEPGGHEEHGGDEGHGAHDSHGGH